MTHEDLLVGAVRWRLGGSGGKQAQRSEIEVLEESYKNLPSFL
jgi:hypothetical protein